MVELWKTELSKIANKLHITYGMIKMTIQLTALYKPAKLIGSCSVQCPPRRQTVGWIMAYRWASTNITDDYWHEHPFELDVNMILQRLVERVTNQEKNPLNAHKSTDPLY